MGKNYTFTFMTKKENLLTLIEAFSKRLSKKDRDRFSGFHIYEPELEACIANSWGESSTIQLGIKLLQSNDECGSINHYCFSLLPAIDESIEVYFQDRDYYPDKEDGKYPLGCAYTSLYVAKNCVLLQVSAATSSLGKLFEDSSNIQSLFKGIADEVGNTTIFLDKEDDLYWWQLHPESKREVKPSIDLLSNYKETSIIDVDAYVIEAERLAGKELC